MRYRERIKEQEIMVDKLQQEKEALNDELRSVNQELTTTKSTVESLQRAHDEVEEELKKKEACLAETAENYVGLNEIDYHRFFFREQ